MEIENIENNENYNEEEINTNKLDEENEDIDDNEDIEEDEDENFEEEKENNEEEQQDVQNKNPEDEGQYKEIPLNVTVKGISVDFNTRKIDSGNLNTFFKKDSNKGLTCLQNLGNSCYLNCALQCLSNSIELVYYFISGMYKEEINLKSKYNLSNHIHINHSIRGKIL